MIKHTWLRAVIALAFVVAWQAALPSAAQDDGVEIPASLGNDLPTNAPIGPAPTVATEAQPAAPSGPLPPQAQQDKEWLTAYMLAHKGYRLDHMDALEDAFGKMSPTQLATLRMFYEQKHASDMQAQALYQRAQANVVAMDEARVQRQTRAMNQINTEETGASTLEDQRLNQMHQEAAENYMQEEAQKTPYPYYHPGNYGAPYGPYRGY